MTTLNQTSENRTIVCFHTGRGGRFHNQGHVTFVGEMDINKVMDYESNKLFYRNRNKKGQFCAPFYTDCNGNEMITEKQAKTGVGQLDWDGPYDTDICCYLDECTETELEMIKESTVYKSRSLEAEVEKLLENLYK